jgi:hypothetical protein
VLYISLAVTYIGISLVIVRVRNCLGSHWKVLERYHLPDNGKTQITKLEGIADNGWVNGLTRLYAGSLYTHMCFGEQQNSLFIVMPQCITPSSCKCGMYQHGELHQSSIRTKNVQESNIIQHIIHRSSFNRKLHRNLPLHARAFAISTTKSILN